MEESRLPGAIPDAEEDALLLPPQGRSLLSPWGRSLLPPRGRSLLPPRGRAATSSAA